MILGINDDHISKTKKLLIVLFSRFDGLKDIEDNDDMVNKYRWSCVGGVKLLWWITDV